MTPIALALGASLAPGICSAVPGDKLGGEFRVNTHVVGVQSQTAVAMSGAGDVVFAWHSYEQDGDQGGIYAQRYDVFGRPRGGEFRVNTTVTGRQVGPAVAMDQDGDFIVTWSGYADGSGEGVFAQRYDRNGVAQGGQIQVNVATAGHQYDADVAMDQDGDFVVVWSGVGYPANSVWARRYDRLGVAQGGEFQVDVPGANAAFDPMVAMDADGDWVVTWSSTTIEADGGGAARRYDRFGAAQGAEFLINTPATGSQVPTDVDMDDAGNFVVVWTDYAEAYAQKAYARRFNAAGVAQGAEFKVHTDTHINGYAAVAMDTDGDFLVSWLTAIDFAPAPLEVEIWARRFDRLGAAAGPEFRVNTYTSGHQTYPVAAMDARGGFVIGWTSLEQDGDGYGVYAQRYRGYDTFARALPDLNGNFTPEVGSVFWTGTAWVGRVRDSFTGELLGSVTFTAGFDVYDVAFHGSAESPQFAAASASKSGVGGRLELRPLGGGVTAIGELKRPIRLQTLPDVNGNGTPDLAVLDLDPATDAVRGLVREGSTLASIRMVNFSAGYLPIDLAVLPDLSGNAKSELAVLGQNYMTGGVRVETRDAFTGALFNTTAFSPDAFPYQLAVAPDMDGGGKPELVVVGVDDVYQDTVAQVLDSVTDRIVRLVHFGTHAPINGLVVLPDQTGNGKPELAVLQQDPVLDRPVLEIRDAGTDGLVRSIWLSSGFVAQGLLLLDDFDGNGRPELGAHVANKLNAQPRLQIRDSESGGLIRALPLK